MEFFWQCSKTNKNVYCRQIFCFPWIAVKWALIYSKGFYQTDYFFCGHGSIDNYWLLFCCEQINRSLSFVGRFNLVEDFQSFSLINLVHNLKVSFLISLFFCLGIHKKLLKISQLLLQFALSSLSTALSKSPIVSRLYRCLAPCNFLRCSLRDQ